MATNPVEMAKAIELWPVERLKPYARNARTHSASQIEKIAASIVEFGFTNPVLVDENDGIIAGHGRLMAAQKLGMAEVPVIPLTHLSDAQRRAYILADNRLALDAGWDEDMLASELAELQDDGFDLALTGFSEDELGELLAEEDGGAADGADEDDAPEVPFYPTSVPGDVWICGPHRVMCGDSCSVDAVGRLMAGVQAECLWTDPPYNVAYEGSAGSIMNDDMSDEKFMAFLSEAFRNAFTFMSEGSSFYVAHPPGPDGRHFYNAAIENEFHLQGTLIWRKNSLVLGRYDYHPQHEPILYGWKPGAGHRWYGARDKTTIHELTDSPFIQVGDNEWQITLGETTMIVRGEALTVEYAAGSVFFEEKPARNGEHPTMKPVGLIERMLANSTKRGDVVLDLFGGSGSTLIACQKTGRQARLMELDPKFVDVIVRRWQDFTGQSAHLDGDGRSFNEMASDRKPIDGP